MNTWWLSYYFVWSGISKNTSGFNTEKVLTSNFFTVVHKLCPLTTDDSSNGSGKIGIWIIIASGVVNRIDPRSMGQPTLVEAWSCCGLLECILRELRFAQFHGRISVTPWVLLKIDLLEDVSYFPWNTQVVAGSFDCNRGRSTVIVWTRQRSFRKRSSER